MLKDIRKYIKTIRNRISTLVPEEELENIMTDVSNVVCNNWINGSEYELTKQQIMSLVRRHIAKKYSSN